MELNPIPKRLRLWIKSLHFGRRSVDTRYAMLEACIIGILSAFAALLLKKGVGWLGGWRIQVAHQYPAWLVLPAIGLTFGLLAGWLLQTYSPASSGGGIPQVKAALARYPIPLSLKVAIFKIIGTTLILGAGFTLGRRAPTVHIGAALAAQLSSWIPTTPEHRRQMIAAGAAAGLAAGFNTPIAGVLFVVEELMRDVSDVTLETAIVASFTGAVVSRLLDSADLNLPASWLSDRASSFSAPEIPFYLFLGAIAGLLGALFNQGMMFSFWVNRRVGLPLAWRIGLVGLVSGTIIAFLPPFFQDNSGLREFLVYGDLSWRNIAIAFVAHFVLTILAYSTGAPGGLFAPALVMGSALGYLVGDFANLLSGVSAESTYALAGMGAFFTAVGRIPVTAIVIVFELTTDFNIVLPLMVTCAVSYLVAESISRGSIYEHLLKTSGIKVNKQPETPRNDFLNKLTAVDVMQSQVETLESELTLDEVMLAISRSHHRGFPVVAQGKLVGIITQSDLANLNERSPTTLLKQIMTPNPITVQPDTSLSNVLYLLNRYQLSRLPVTQANKLIGIITRTDIIRSEVKQLNEGTERASKPSPSYVVYQTRSPALGKGRILLPLANPQTAPALMKVAAAIARYHQYELECLQIIKIPKHTFPSEAYVNTQESRKLLHRVERLGRQLKVPVHTQIRLAQDRVEAILETIAEREIKLLLMGWKGNTSTPGAIFGNLVDRVVHKAPCELMLIKLGTNPYSYPKSLDREATWLIPMAGGPNAKRAIELLPGLTSLYSGSNPKLLLCQVYSPTTPDIDCSLIEQSTDYLRQNLSLPVRPIAVRSRSVSEAIIRLASEEKCNTVVLGASREGLLQHAIHGNIPEAIANGIEGTAILVRGAIE
jgi:CIC family chloride channel protein